MSCVRSLLIVLRAVPPWRLARMVEAGPLRAVRMLASLAHHIDHAVLLVLRAVPPWRLARMVEAGLLRAAGIRTSSFASDYFPGYFLLLWLRLRIRVSAPLYTTIFIFFVFTQMYSNLDGSTCVLRTSF